MAKYWKERAERLEERALKSEATIARVRVLIGPSAKGWGGKAGWLYVAGVTDDAESRADQLKECASELEATLTPVQEEAHVHTYSNHRQGGETYHCKEPCDPASHGKPRIEEPA